MPDSQTIALSFDINNDENVLIKVNPNNWQNASIEKKWYIMYHELGHDILNLEHGQGGKMMFNFADKEYSWMEFFIDRQAMFDYYKNSIPKDNNNEAIKYILIILSAVLMVKILQLAL